ncbi:MAG: hypothetical protein WA900_02950 [Casimicrobiaceae bacterium]
MTELPHLHFDHDAVTGFGALLERFGPRAFASPYRSTTPLLALTKDAWPVFDSILAECGSEADCTVHFEYKTHLPNVDGNPSQTDAMVLSATSAVAVEAKWTEPRYETVSTRLKGRVAALSKEDPHNVKLHETSQRAVIQAWLDLLQPLSRGQIQIEDVGDVVYQVIHRAASARATSRNPRLVYLHFRSSPAIGAAASDYRNDLDRLHAVLGHPPDFPFYVVDLPVEPTRAFRAIESLKKGTTETDQRVREAIRSSCLFNFGIPTIERIG